MIERWQFVIACMATVLGYSLNSHLGSWFLGVGAGFFMSYAMQQLVAQDAKKRAKPEGEKP
jgi:hypothetical protein